MSIGMRFRSLVTVMILLGFIGGGLWFLKQAYVDSVHAGASVVFLVSPGDAFADVVKRLADQGLLAYPRWYRVYGWIDGRVRHPRAGRYTLSRGLSYRSLARQLSEGPERIEATVTLIEGWTVDQNITYLSKEKGILVTDIESLTGRSADRGPFDPVWRTQFSFLRPLPAERSLEGYLFPDTYRVWQDELPKSLIRKQLQEFADRFGSASLTSASAPLKTLDEAVILASIVEKEVRTSADRKMVAGIFLRRLKEGMALQSDATLTYAVGSGARANVQELASTSPYNTYKFRGLPPGPIANPGADALEAVLHPTLSSYRYFLTDPSGKVLYASTFEEHIRNRQKAGYSS